MNSIVEIFAPMNGILVDISTVPDVVFSNRMIGDGFAIEPDDGIISSPVDGEIVSIFPTKHAICIRELYYEYEFIVHFGINTVTLNGLGFEVLAQKDQHVKHGQEIIHVDIDLIRDKIASIITSIVVTNLDGLTVSVNKYGKISRNDLVASIEL